jgi:hypothetical protein
VARCDEGYLCNVCGLPADTLPESLLYLRYILGEVTVEVLGQAQETHIRCCPAIAQYIVHPAFEPVVCTDVFARQHFPLDFQTSEETRITAAWATLYEAGEKGFSLLSYIATLGAETRV